MEKIKINKDEIKIYNIVYAITSEIDYEMSRYMLLENLKNLKYDEYVILEGYHCSCYDFDDTEWEAMKYTREELVKLAEANLSQKQYYNEKKELYEYIIKHLKFED